MTFEVKMDVEFTNDNIESLLNAAFHREFFDCWSNQLKVTRMYDNDSHLRFVDGVPLHLYDDVEDESYVLDIDKLRCGLNTWLNNPENYTWVIGYLMEIEYGAGRFEFDPVMADEVIQTAVFGRVMF